MSLPLVFHSEGDSISAGAGWQGLYLRQSSLSWTFHNYAVASATIQGNGGNSVIDREATIAAAYVTGAYNVLTVFIGANNFGSSNSTTNDSDMAALVGYCSRMKLRGFYVVVWTILPRGLAWTGSAVTFNANRATYNPQYVAMCGNQCHAIIDAAADPIMGPDGGSPYTTGNAANDTTLYNNDGVHPTSFVGQAHLARICTPVLDSFGNGAGYTQPARRFRVVF